MPAATPAAPTRRRRTIELADIFREHGVVYRRGHRLSLQQLKVMRAVEVCRTSALGGHLERCAACGLERPAYNSCRNRHCPKCQRVRTARWVEARRAELLPVGYFHTVFTLPHELRTLALLNKRLVYSALFRAAAHALKVFALDPRHGLGGRLGFTAVLHTWDQQLRFHPHLHCVIPGGALSRDGSRWTHARKGYLFPLRPLAAVFRGKFIDDLKAAYRAGDVRPPSDWGADPHAGLARLLRNLWKKKWVVYTKPPFAGPAKVLDYLGRYTHRVAISNHRILALSGQNVSFSYRDRAEGNKQKTATIPAQEFIQRFLHHVLPRRFVRIRHFGFLAPRSKGEALPRCRNLLGVVPEPAVEEEPTTAQLIFDLTGMDVTTCPECHERAMHIVQALEPTAPAWLDSS